jgi:hypothetical protein
MASEVSIPKSLSGGEMLQALVTAFRSALLQDQRFHSHMAYSGFTATIHLQLTPQMSFVPDINTIIPVFGGEPGEIGDKIDETIDIPLRPPNQVREEADLPQPVLVTDNEGRTTEKWVKRGEVPKGAAVPKNRVMGNAT